MEKKLLTEKGKETIKTVQRGRGGRRVYTRRDLLLDREGGESGGRLDEELGLLGESAGQTPAQCGPWQLAHL